MLKIIQMLCGGRILTFKGQRAEIGCACYHMVRYVSFESYCWKNEFTGARDSFREI